ncbi:hypothetical protein, partial [Staphylococcus warneri]
MEQIKFKTFTESSLEKLESTLNDFLKSDEGETYRLLNVTIKQTEEQKFPNIEEDFT